MKTKLTILLVLVLFFAKIQAQQVIANDNTLSAMVDGKEFKTQPRKIKIGVYNWVTANTAKPDRSLRFWLYNFVHNDMLPETGSYLIINEHDTNEKLTEELIKKGNYRGFAVVKYVEETKSPRMEYHVGESIRNSTGTLVVTSNKNNILEGTFSFELEGSYWKERASATVFGGMGRLKDKMVDRAKTNATGFDQDIDPEGNGYRRQENTDKISITGGKFKLKY
jgi:hypothetical protein